MSGKSDKKTVESGCGKEIVSVVSPGKGLSNTEREALNGGSVALPNGDVINFSDRSAGLKSPSELIGTPLPPKKFKLSEDEAHRDTMVNQLKVRLLTSATPRACLAVRS